MLACELAWWWLLNPTFAVSLVGAVAASSAARTSCISGELGSSSPYADISPSATFTIPLSDAVPLPPAPVAAHRSAIATMPPASTARRVARFRFWSLLELRVQGEGLGKFRVKAFGRKLQSRIEYGVQALK